MTDDDLQRTWQAQGPPVHLDSNTEQLLTDLRRNQQTLATIVLLRDIREVGVSVVLIPVWVVMGVFSALPWTWYLTIPGLVWVAGFLLIDRRIRQRRAPELDESIRRCATAALAEVDHQVALLRNVFWWYQLPLLLPILAFFGQVTWQVQAQGVDPSAALAVAATVVGLVNIGIYWLNQHAVRTGLLPRRRELQALLDQLTDEAI